MTTNTESTVEDRSRSDAQARNDAIRLDAMTVYRSIDETTFYLESAGYTADEVHTVLDVLQDRLTDLRQASEEIALICMALPKHS